MTHGKTAEPILQQELPQVSEELQQAVDFDTPCGSPKQKNSSRRNAWGNLSYADLITQAIKSSPEQRLTLSQIYDWVVKNVPYFKDKGDSASSSGWKVSKKKSDNENSWMVESQYWGKTGNKSPINHQSDWQFLRCFRYQPIRKQPWCYGFSQKSCTVVLISSV